MSTYKISLPCVLSHLDVAVPLLRLIGPTQSSKLVCCSVLLRSAGSLRVAECQLQAAQDSHPSSVRSATGKYIRFVRLCSAYKLSIGKESVRSVHLLCLAITAVAIIPILVAQLVCADCAARAEYNGRHLLGNPSVLCERCWTTRATEELETYQAHLIADINDLLQIYKRKAYIPKTKRCLR